MPCGFVPIRELLSREYFSPNKKVPFLAGLNRCAGFVRPGLFVPLFFLFLWLAVSSANASQTKLVFEPSFNHAKNSYGFHLYPSVSISIRPGLSRVQETWKSESFQKATVLKLPPQLVRGASLFRKADQGTVDLTTTGILL